MAQDKIETPMHQNIAVLMWIDAHILYIYCWSAVCMCLLLSSIGGYTPQIYTVLIVFCTTLPGSPGNCGQKSYEEE